MDNSPILKRLTLNSTLKPFDCNDSDLNDFFYNDALEYLRQLLAVTYVLESKKETIAYFSVLNDKIDNRNPKTKKRISRLLEHPLPHPKRLRSFPAVKIGRLAVHVDYQNNKIGTEIIEWIKVSFTLKNKTGCRFVTADAYKASLDFYKKNGFKFLTDKDKNKDTRLMYLDLFPFRS